MGKYGKHFKEQIIAQWKDSYFDYKKMKKELKHLMTHVPEQSHHLLIQEESDDNVSSVKSELGEIATAFIAQVEVEFKKFYDFFVFMEKELYKNINSQLHHKSSYAELSVEGINEKMDELSNVIFIAVCLNRFINTNVKAMSKIMKKFDKKHQSPLGFASLHFFKAKLGKKNDNLEYLLQFKLIDETSTIVEQLMQELQALHHQKQPGDASSDEKVKEILKCIRIIDNETEYRIHYQEWLYYIRNGDNIIKNNPSAYINDVYNPMLSSFLIDDNILFKLLSGKSRLELLKNKTELNLFNKVNIALCLVFTFCSNAFNSSIIPSLCNWLESKGSIALYGIILSIGPLLSMVSLALFHGCGFGHYKGSLLISLFLFAVGNLLYSFPSDILWVFLGRSLIGLGSSQLTVRRYITHFVAKDSLSKVSMMHVIASLGGFACGPFFSLIAWYLPEKNVSVFIQFNPYTYPGWIGLGLSLMLMLVFTVFFTRPTHSRFTMMTNMKGTDFRGDKISTLILQGNEAPLLSEAEKKSIAQAEAFCDEQNQQVQFDDPNKIPNELSHITVNQLHSFGSLSKAFLTLLMFFFTSSLNSEAVILLVAIDFGKKTKLYYFIYFIGGLFTLVFFTCLLIKKTMKSRPSTFQLFCFFLMQLMTSVGFYLMSMNGFSYYCNPFFALNLIINGIIDMVSSSLFGNIFPSQWNICGINVGCLLIVGVFLGKALAGLIIGLPMVFLSKPFPHRYISLGIITALSLICMTLVYFNKSHLRSKALTRLLRSKSGDSLN